MDALRNFVNKIEQLSLKNKIFIFLCLLVFSGLWVVLRNPVYQGTWAFVFPIGNDIGDGRIYYGVKNGYNKPLSWEIPKDAYYHHESITGSDSLTIESAGGSTGIQSISIIEGIHFYALSGDKLIISTENSIELPRKGIRCLVVKNGSQAELYLSSVEFFYQKQLLNRDVAATFPFYVAYTSNKQNYAYDKAQLDTDLYDVSYERKQRYADDYVDLLVPHYRALNFKRDTDFPFGHSRLVMVMSILSAFLMACFLFFLPFNLLKVFISKDTNRKLFIGMGVYLIGMWLVFRHSGQSTHLGRLTSVINIKLDFASSYIYWITECMHYLVGYSSRVFVMFFLLCTAVWNYNKILEKYLNFNALSKILKYMFLVLPLLSKDCIVFTYATERSNTSALWITLGYILFFRSRILKNNKYFVASVLCLLVGISYRFEIVVVFFPVLLYCWLENINFKRTLKICACGIIVVIFAFFIGKPVNSTLRILQNDAYRIENIVVNHADELTEEETFIFEKIYDAKIKDILYQIYHVATSRDNKNKIWRSRSLEGVDGEDIRKFRDLGVSLIKRYPNDYITHLAYVWRTMFMYDTSPVGIHVMDEPGPYTTNASAEIPNKQIYLAGRSILYSNPVYLLHLKFSIFALLVVSFLFIHNLRIIGSLSIGLLLYWLVLTFFAPAAVMYYIVIFVYWFYFMFGLFIAEVIHSGKIKRKLVLPANIAIILIFLAFAKSGISYEKLPPVYNESTAKWENSTIVSYPYYYRLFGKTIMFASNGYLWGAETIQRRVESITRKGLPINAEEYSFKPVFGQILSSVNVPGYAWKTKITFETAIKNLNIDVYSRIDMRKHIFSALLLLFLYVNICFLKQGGANELLNCLRGKWYSDITSRLNRIDITRKR
ncbi:hypothetical protein FACS1894190_05370 [Spirochaetia bacterium]|nr:hypothetical protein FACS1894190_05370 [Spirochaetia bacterium]